MRKLVATLLIFALCGCTQTPPENTSSTPTEQTEIRLVCSQNTEAIEKVITAFEKETPEVTVTVVKTDKNVIIKGFFLLKGNFKSPTYSDKILLKCL